MTARLHHCGQVILPPEAYPIHCGCGAQLTESDYAALPAAPPQPTDPCPHRGVLIARLTEAFGCGCAGVEVYDCLRHDQLVTPSPVCDRGRTHILTEWERYLGRNCRACRSGDGGARAPLPLGEVGLSGPGEGQRITPSPAAETKPPTLGPPTDPATVSRIAFCTAFFNPHLSANRARNVARFAAHLADQGADLWIAEGVFPGKQPEYLGPTVRHYACRDILWHKERLLNLLVDSLPDQYDAIAWVDADLLWDRRDLVAATLDALRQWPVVQLWSQAQLLGPDDQPLPWSDGLPYARSTAYYNSTLAEPDASTSRSHPGFAWAMRRATWDAVGGLYQYDMVGGGDSSLVIGWYGDFDTVYFCRHNPAWKRSVLDWAEPAHAVVQGRVGHVPGIVRHLYHGDINDRKYWERTVRCSELGYDPARDVIAEPGQPFRWSAFAPAALRDWLHEYLCHTRREDLTPPKTNGQDVQDQQDAITSS